LVRVVKTHIVTKKERIGVFVNNRDTFRDFCLTQDHEEGILDISNDTLLTQIGETGIMPKNIRGKKPKRVAYASIKHVRTILDLNRVGELPPQLTIEKLGELGIPTSEVFHVKNSLQDLALIDEVGRLTPQFESLAHVSVNEYRSASLYSIGPPGTLRILTF